MIRWHFVVVLLLILLPGMVEPVGACVCPEYGSVATEFGEADAVFAGRVIALEVVDGQPKGTVNASMVATLAVIRRWKGPSTATVRVETCGTQSVVCTCGTHFELGAHYLVFASGSPLSTGSCDLTRVFTHNVEKPELEWLGVESLIHELDGLVASSEGEDGG